MGCCSTSATSFTASEVNSLSTSIPADDESVLFERLTLEINQAGLSWLTVLKKRDAFRNAFAWFEVDRVADAIYAAAHQPEDHWRAEVPYDG